MEPQTTTGHVDTRLLPYLQAAGEAQAQRCLRELIEQQAAPIIEGVLRRKVGAVRGSGAPARHGQSQDEQDVEDLRGDILAQVLKRLGELHADSQIAPIADFAGYVAVTAYNAVHMHLRRRYPQRSSLENKLRYLLEHRQGLALWQTERGEWVGGFAAWRPQKPGAGPALQQMLADPHAYVRTALPSVDARQMNPADLVAALLNGAGHPIGLDDLVRILGELWGIKDVKPEPPPIEESTLPPEKLRDTVGRSVVERLDLHRYWEEIRRLPAKQCASLLLQAHDPEGNCLVELLEMQGITSLREMAEAMALLPETLAALWNDLPLEDARIASRLEITAQHVARLRMIARRRLAERLLLSQAA